MLISASEIQPSRCLDCHKPLARKSQYGYLGKFGIPHINRYGDNIHIDCACGAIYVWSYDETHKNGGIWKRRHTLPLFDDKQRIEITKAQIDKHMKNHSAIYRRMK